MSSSSEIIVHVDGGSRGNPGPAAYGVTVETPEGRPVTAFAKFIGTTTNNFAEYQGLLAALEYALNHGYSRVRVLTDSELMARQISGHYKVRSSDLRPLYEKAQIMIGQLESFSIRHVYREQNREADHLANEAMDHVERGVPTPGSAPRAQSTGPNAAPSRQADSKIPPEPLRIAATYQDGVLRPHTHIPLLDNEEVELVIRRRK
jgi:ribonuclease HI